MRRRALLVPLAFLTLGGNFVHAASGPVTIIDLASGCDATDERTNLAAALTAAGYTVTTITTGVVPADLTGEKQVWDIRCQNVLAPGEITTYTSYLVGGGSLFLMGENVSFGALRDASLISFITTLGGGALTLTATGAVQTVQAPFTGPTALASVTYRAVGGTTTAGTGSFVTKDTSNNGGAVAFGPGSLSGAPSGTLIIVWDVNFLDNSRTAGETTLTDNLIGYLAAPTPITPSTIPVPPTAVLALMGIAAAAAFGLRRRVRQAV
jgi:hypothetical protein